MVNFKDIKYIKHVYKFSSFKYFLLFFTIKIIKRILFHLYNNCRIYSINIKQFKLESAIKLVR